MSRYKNHSRSYVVLNGNSGEEFQLYKGLRQGDPISSFIFIIIMEGLHVAMEDAIANGIFMVSHWEHVIFVFIIFSM